MSSVKRSEMEWYIFDYSLNYTKEICGKVLYFEAHGRENISWTQKPEVKCKLFCFFLYYIIVIII